MTTWKKVDKRVPCPICGRPDWCTVSGDNLVVKCMRVESKRPVKQSDGQPAWLHPITDSGKFEEVKSLAHKPMADRLKVSEVRSLLKEFSRNLTSQRLESASRSLGISAESLRAFGIGFCSRPMSYSFPMFDGERKTIGIRLRKEDGKKLCVTGSQNGLFIPSDYEPSPIGDGICEDNLPMVIAPEGPTDAAAARDLGFCAVGRPSNAGGGKMLAVLLKSTCQQDVIVVADRDEAKFRETDNKPFWPGIEGALHLCDQIINESGKLRFVMPPNGAKDIRAWSVSGSHSALFNTITAAPVVTKEWLVRAKRRIDQKRNEYQEHASVA